MLIPVGFLGSSVAPPPSFVGVLDSYTSGLWSAFGIKRLLSSWTGNLIRVRRSSDNTEQDIGYLTDGTLDITALAAFVSTNSAFVVKLYDQSGGTNDFTQATTTLQPRIVDAGTYDGFARFDGTDDVLVSVNTAPANAALSIGGRFNQRSLATAGTSQTLFCHSTFTNVGTSTFGYQQQSNDGSINAYLFTGSSTFRDQTYSAGGTTERAELLVASHATNSLAVYRNGSTVTESGDNAGTVSGNFTAEPIAVGAMPSIQPSTMNGKWFAVWSNSQAANAAAITSAL